VGEIEHGTDTARPLPLCEIRVLDLSGDSAPHCGQLLALFGADVVLAEPEQSRTTRDDLARLAYNAGKRSLALDREQPEGRALLDELSHAADVLIDDGRAIGDFDPRAESPALIHVSVSAFGLAGPRATWLDDELIAQAAGGLLYLSGDAEHPPAGLGIPLATGVAGAQAACAVLIALAQRRRTGVGARIDVSRQESVANLLFTTQFMANSDDAPGRRGDVSLSVQGRRIPRKTLWACADGFVTWNLWSGPGMGRKNEPIFEWMREQGVPEAADLLSLPWEKMSTGDLSAELRERVNRCVGDFFAQRSKALIGREAFERRILLYVIQSFEDIARDKQLDERDAFGDFDLPNGRRVSIVSRPVRSSAYRVEIPDCAPAWGADTESIRRDWLEHPRPSTIPTPTPTTTSTSTSTPATATATATATKTQGTASGSLPLEGIRVLDFGWLVVSPLTTKTLAMFGADVVKLEFRGRPDPLRMTAPYPQGRPSMDGSAPFISINASKRSLGIDLNRPEARELILRMARKADIVCENFTPGTASRLGYDYQSFRAVKPDVIMMSLSMQGQTGARANQPGLGNHLQAMCGLDYITGFPDGNPQGPNQVLPDFIGPGIAVCSLLAALEHRRLRGEGQYIDISQLEAMMLYMQPGLIQYGVDGVSPERRGNRSPKLAPHGVYPVRGEDRWIAIVTRDDAEWRRLHELLPEPARSSLPADLSRPQRLARGSELDAELARWSAQWDGNQLATALQDRGVRSYLVCDARDLLADPQLGFREHYHFPQHAKLGPSLIDAPAFRISDIEPRLDAGPLYAADGVAVLEDWLDIDADGMSDLLACGAVVL